LIADASAVTLTNWPSSTSRGVIFIKSTGKYIIATDKKQIREVYSSNAVSEETILKISKEIAVKFIEVGRITPATFPATFTTIYSTIEQTVRKNGA
jgi:hypothetical protein